MTKDDNKKFYFTPLPAEERQEALITIFKKGDPLTLWKKNDDKKVESFKILALKDQTLTLEKQSSTFLEKLTSKEFPFAQKGELVLFKTPLHRFQYFSSGRLWFNENENHYVLIVDHDIYRAEQRQDFRLESNKTNSIQLAIEGQIFRAQDASAGGACVEILPRDAGFFLKGKMLGTSILMINNKRFKIPSAKVMKVWDAQVHQSDNTLIAGQKMSLQFQDLSEKEREELCKHIINEARKEDIDRRS